MSNKFLPFIVEKSPLHSIYHTMLSRSKGVNHIVLLEVFYAVGKHGIKTVREFVNSQSEKMDTSSLYQAISNHFKDAVSSDDYKAFKLLEQSMTVKQLTEEDSKYQGYNHSDIIGFIYVTALLEKTSEYFKIDYEGYLKNHAAVIEDLRSFILLDEKNPDFEVLVASKEELVSKILYYSLIYPVPGKTYKFSKYVYDESKEDKGVPF